MPSIRIRIGAALDPGAARVLEPLLAAVGRTRTKLKKAGEDAAEEFVGGYRSAPAKAKKVHDDIAKEAEKAAKKQAKAAEDAAKAEARAYEYVYQIKQRYLKQEEKDQARAAASLMSSRRQTHTEVLSNAGRTFGGVVSKGIGVAGQIAGGAGVNLDIGSYFGKAVASQTAATQLSNSAYQEGAAGAAGVRQDPKKLLAEIRDVADKTAMSVESAQAGMAAFVGKTGELDTGREVFGELARLAKASGTDLNDMVSAAGDVSLSLGEIPNKGERIVSVMRAIAGQGKLGAVEIKDLASKMAKLSAAAPQYKGDVGENLAKLGALAQLARQKGGASTAGEAVNSVARMTDTLKTPARLKQFLGQGGMKKEDIFDEKTGLLNDPFEILKKSIKSKGNDPVGFAKMWASVIGKKPAEALVNTYRQAGGGDKGMGAVDAELSKFMKSSMGKGEIDESFAARMADTDSKVQLFNNRMERIASDTLPKLVPAFERLAPLAEQAANGFANLAVSIADNPMKAVAAALAASVAKAGVEKALEVGIGAALGRASGLTVASATIGITAATIALGIASDAKNKGMENVEGRVKVSEDVLAAAEREKKTKGKLSPQTVADLQAERERVSGAIDKGSQDTAWYMPVMNMLNMFGSTKGFSGTWTDIGEEQGARGAMGTLTSTRKGIDALLGEAADKSGSAADKHDMAAAKLSTAADALTAAAGRMNGGAAGSTPGATTGPVPVRK